MQDLLQELLGNVGDRLREPLCMGTEMINEQASCDDPEAIPAPDFVLWNVIPVPDNIKMTIKSPVCDAAGAIRTLFNCDV